MEEKQLVGRVSDFPALMIGIDDIILERIVFGGVKEFEKLFGNTRLS